MTPPQTLLSTLRAALQEFASSPSNLRIIRTISRSRPFLPSTSSHTPSHPSPHPHPSTILILDSSFNPPTQAHLRIATSALQAHHASPKRLLLLLATQNADKAPKPAAFEQRLAMMGLLAEGILREVYADQEGRQSRDTDEGGVDDIAVDIGITKLPYFVDKARAVTSESGYGMHTNADDEAGGAGEGREGLEGDRTPIKQIHLIGYDTLIRLLDTKYYPPQHTLSPLTDLFQHHELRVMYRPGDGWGGEGEQMRYLEALRAGEREGEGGRREWAGRIEMVEGWGEGKGEGRGDGAVSSTKAREAAEGGDREGVEGLCSGEVAGWVVGEGLYRGGE